jgi:hypothetical protein
MRRDGLAHLASVENAFRVDEPASDRWNGGRGLLSGEKQAISQQMRRGVRWLQSFFTEIYLKNRFALL